MNPFTFRAAIFLSLSLATTAIATNDIRTERVQFERGASSAVVEGSIKGYEIVDYVLRASAGQMMNASMACADWSRSTASSENSATRARSCPA